jgi:hypothetical protein
MGRDLVEMNFGLWSCAALESSYKEFRSICFLQTETVGKR